MERTPVFKINIPSPCSQSWDDMSPAEQGRFCGQCTKTIVDFTTWSDKDIAQYIRGSKEKICGRFTDDQLDRNLLHVERERTNALVPAILISTALAVGIAGNASANENSIADKQSSVQVDNRMDGADTTGVDTVHVPAAINTDAKSEVVVAALGIMREQVKFMGYTVSSVYDDLNIPRPKEKKKKTRKK